ncbi:Uncharacterised protein [Mycobacterium tuberculosis]|nr:Uncharacterised protein [Mycobacterium tuberculosis]
MERLGGDRPRRHRGRRARLLHRTVPRYRGDRRAHRHHPHGRRPVSLPPQWVAGAVSRALRRIVGGQLRRDTADRGQHHNHRLGDQRRVLRQEEPVHGVLRHEVQPAVQLVWHLGRLRGLSRFTQHEFELQRGVCRVSGRLGARGADRPVLCERGRGASQPGRRRRSKLRRHPCGDIERMERRAIANRGGRQGAWRRGHLLHLSLPVTVAPQHL